MQEPKQTAPIPTAESAAPKAQAGSPPPAAPLTFTQAELEAYVADHVKKATEPIKALEEQLAKLKKYEEAEALPDNVRASATEIRAAQRHAKALVRDFKLPDAAIFALSKVLDPDHQEAIARGLAPTGDREALASAQEKVRRAATETIETSGRGGGAARQGMTWEQAKEDARAGKLSDTALQALLAQR